MAVLPSHQLAIFSYFLCLQVVLESTFRVSLYFARNKLKINF